MTTPVYIEQTVAAALGSSPEITALCDGRVYPLKMPQGTTLPALVYLRAEGTPEYTLQGYGSESVVIAVNSFAHTYEEAKELALAVRPVMTAPPIKAILQKDADVYDEDVAALCVSAEYLCQQKGVHNG